MQRHRQRLIKQGKLEEEQPKGEECQGGGAQQGGAQQGQPGFEASQHAYEVLPEVLQQQVGVGGCRWQAAAWLQYKVETSSKAALLGLPWGWGSLGAACGAAAPAPLPHRLPPRTALCRRLAWTTRTPSGASSTTAG